MKSKLNLLFLLSGLFLASNSKAALSGSGYTINAANAASATNYKTWASAVSDLVSGTRSDGGTANGPGVSGATYFTVTGMFTEKVSIGTITGTSSTNRVYFYSYGANIPTSGIQANSDTVSKSNYTIQLNGCDYVTIYRLKIMRNGTNPYAKVIDVTGGSTNCTITSCYIYGQKTSSSTSNNLSVISSMNSQDNYLSITENTIKYGSYGILIKGGGSAALETGNIIASNKIDSCSKYGIAEYYLSTNTTRNNIITNLRLTSAVAIYISTCPTACLTYGNKIYCVNGGTGIYIYNCVATGGTASNALYNNFVGVGGTLTSNGIRITNCYLYMVYYNNVSMTNTNLSSRGCLLERPTTGTYGYVILKNNNLVNLGGGLAISVSANAVTYGYLPLSNYNNLYTTGTKLGKWGSANQTALSDWNTASSLDANSVSANPTYVSASDLHTSSSSINGKGTPVSGYTTDIDGTTRNSTTPDIGADEF